MTKIKFFIIFSLLVFIVQPVQAQENKLFITTTPLEAEELDLSNVFSIIKDYPVSLSAGEARLKVYESMDSRWNAGISAAVTPDFSDDNDFSIAATIPFLSIRYKFN